MFLQHRAPRGADDTINRNIFPFSKWYYRGIASHKMVARFMQLVLKKTNKHNRKKLTQKGIIAVEDPGEEPGGPTFRLLFLEAWRGRKKFLETSPPTPYLRVWMTAPSPSPVISRSGSGAEKRSFDELSTCNPIQTWLFFSLQRPPTPVLYNFKTPFDRITKITQNNI